MASASAPTFSQLMTGEQFQTATAEPRSTNVDEGRKVWVVTVSGSFKTDGSPGTAGKEKQFYSAVVDAASGIITDDCVGCGWVTVSK